MKRLLVLLALCSGCRTQKPTPPPPPGGQGLSDTFPAPPPGSWEANHRLSRAYADSVCGTRGQECTDSVWYANYVPDTQLLDSAATVAIDSALIEQQRRRDGSKGR